MVEDLEPERHDSRMDKMPNIRSKTVDSQEIRQNKMLPCRLTIGACLFQNLPLTIQAK